MNMKKPWLLIALLCVPGFSHAVGGGHLEKAPINLGNQSSLQRGAAVFVNYCLSCHGAKLQRFKRTADDLGLTLEQTEKNLVFTGTGVLEPMTVAMTQEDGKKWFGAAPPDLSVVARSRGSDWLYAYLKGFYRDDARPWGVNNLVFKDVSMPHVLAQLQGEQRLVGEGQEQHLELAEQGTLSEEEYEQLVVDLVAFLTYLGEPSLLTRYSTGGKVILFLAVLLIAAYLLKREYWKDVH